MASVIVRRSILLKAVVTDRLRKDVSAELQEAAEEVERRIEELDVAGRRYITDLQRSDLQRAMAIRSQVENEKKRQQDMRDQLLQRKAEVAQWKNGEEVVRGTIEGFAEVREGDNLAVVLGGTELVVEDDLVKAIRELSSDEVAGRLRDALRATEEADEAEGDVIGQIETP